MKIWVVKHFMSDDESRLAEWAARKGHRMGVVFPPGGEPFPEAGDGDALIVLGGPMGVHEEHLHPWLTAEKRFLKQTVDRGKPVLGICLGAQLLADVLGGSVARNAYMEIGWFPVRRNGQDHPLFSGVPDHFPAFHWHADCVELPDGAVPLAFSDATRVQAFGCGRNVLGLQFHPEATPRCVKGLVQDYREALSEPSPYVQTADRILNQQEQGMPQSAAILDRILDNMDAMFTQDARS